MACSYVTTDQDNLSELDLQETHKFLNLEKFSSNLEDKTIELQRGGIIVKTENGNIQFGMPPETVKDVINQKLDVPLYYIIPTDRFDKRFGINVAEFEFPAYFNFFIKKRKINLVCSQEAEMAIRTVFQETLLGPVDHPELEKDFVYGYPRDKFPDFRKENIIFSVNENDPNDKGLTIDTLLNFIQYDQQSNIAEINENGVQIQIKNEDGFIEIIQNGVVLEKIKDSVKLQEHNIQNLITNFNNDARSQINEMHLRNVRKESGFNQLSIEDISDEDEYYDKYENNIQLQRKLKTQKSQDIQTQTYSGTNILGQPECCEEIINIKRSSQKRHSQTLKENRGNDTGFNKFVWTAKGGKAREMSYFQSINIKTNETFTPPDFGITVLGASHGFDPQGSTSGFIIWSYGKGIMVDPPPFASSYLKKMGIQTNILIKAIIITHCHADHDAGAFHKVLDDSQIEIITTRTIMNSFLRKYSALSKISSDQLKVLFNFRPVIIDQEMNIHGAKFKFFYSLHTIPCIGFSCKVEDKSIYFSGDTFYHPQKLKELYEKNKLSYHRYQQLAFPDFESQSIILHEAGVPPIHTPQSVLAELPAHIKNKLYLIHIARKDLQKDMGLKIIGMGVENTLIILPSNGNQNQNIKRRLELLSNIDILQSLTIKNINWLLDSLKEEQYKPGELIVQEGTIGDKFYIIETGVARIFSLQKDNQFERYFSSCDYFGESSLIRNVFNSKRQASVQAVTDITLLVLEKNDFWFIFGDGSDGPGKVIQKFYNLSSSRQNKVQKVMQKNSLLQDLSAGQKTQLEMILQLKEAKKGEVIWKKESPVQFGILIKKGAYQFFDCDQEEDEDLVPGYFISETKAMMEKGDHSTNLKCTNKGEYFKIQKQDLIRFLKKNPGLNIQFRDLIYFD